MIQHKLHLEIANIITKKNFTDCEILYDKACGGNQNLPLFLSSFKSNMTEVCNVDILILKENKINVIIEIDESNIKPTQICGKFLTSSMSSYYIHDTHKCEMDDSVLFIQIVDIRNLKEKTLKIDQFINIEKSILSILPLKNSDIKEYMLLQFIDDNFRMTKSLINSIKKHLNS